MAEGAESWSSKRSDHRAAHAHQELLKAVVELLDMGEYPHPRMVRRAGLMRPCSAGERSELYGQSAPARGAAFSTWRRGDPCGHVSGRAWAAGPAASVAPAAIGFSSASIVAAIQNISESPKATCMLKERASGCAVRSISYRCRMPRSVRSACCKVTWLSGGLLRLCGSRNSRC